jgi:hypothetical protein
VDLARLRNNAPTFVDWPGGGQVGVRAVSPAHLAHAARFQSDLAQQGAGPIALVSSQLLILSFSLCAISPPYAPLECSWLTDSLTPEMVAGLFEHWFEAQRQATPDMDQLRREMMRAMAADGDMIVDGLMAEQLPVTQFYAAGLVDITQGQMAYYLTARACYLRLYGPQSGPRRAINRELLQ